MEDLYVADRTKWSVLRIHVIFVLIRIWINNGSGFEEKRHKDVT